MVTDRDIALVNDDTIIKIPAITCPFCNQHQKIPIVRCYNGVEWGFKIVHECERCRRDIHVQPVIYASTSVGASNMAMQAVWKVQKENIDDMMMADYLKGVGKLV